ncbi:hypothetical protein [Thermococcus sp. GR6]|uniref:hypothetical protein n=1 Tax=Thermococcus sp. GR6 TaxID=1638256 RepID=UPI0014321F97|nr:hypothetical protein [Thermococcus sp. GR6]NJE42910.1 hypothetical protein [Thermococcus sp. GR6]
MNGFEKLLERMFVPGDIIEVRVLSRRGGKGHNISTANRVRHFRYPDDLKAMASFIENARRRIEEGTWAAHGVYFSVNPRARLKKDSQGSGEEDVKYAPTLFVDIDVFKKKIGTEVWISVDGIRVMPTKEWAASNKETAKAFLERLAVELYSRLAELEMAPQIITDSGFGLQMFFALNPPIERSEELPPIERQRDFRERYRDAFRALKTIIADAMREFLEVEAGEGIDAGQFIESMVDDAVADVARVARVPEVPNSKLAYIVEDGQLKFDPEGLMETRVLFIDIEENELFRHGGLENNPLDTEALISMAKKVERVKTSSRVKATTTMEFRDIDTKMVELLEQRDFPRIMERAREQGIEFVEVEDEDTVNLLVNRILRMYPPEGIRHNFFLQFPSFFMLRGIGPRTTVEVFIKAFREAVTLGWDEEGELMDRLRALVDAVVNFLRWKLGEKFPRPPTGWRSIVFAQEGRKVAPHWLPLRSMLAQLPEEWKERLDIQTSGEIDVQEHVVSTIQSLNMLLSKVRGSASRRSRTGKKQDSSNILTESLKDLRKRLNYSPKTLHEEVLYGLASALVSEEDRREEVINLWNELLKEYERIFLSKEGPVRSVVKLRKEKNTGPATTGLLLILNNGRRDIVDVPTQNGAVLSIEEDNVPKLLVGKEKKLPDPRPFVRLNELMSTAGVTLFLTQERVIELLALMFGMDSLEFEAKHSKAAKLLLKGYYSLVYRSLISVIDLLKSMAVIDVSSDQEKAIRLVLDIIALTPIEAASSVSSADTMVITAVRGEDRVDLVVPLHVLIERFRELKTLAGGLKFDSVLEVLTKVFSAKELYLKASNERFLGKDKVYVIKLQRILDVARAFVPDAEGFERALISSIEEAEERYRRRINDLAQKFARALVGYGELEFERVYATTGDVATAREVFKRVRELAEEKGHIIREEENPLRLKIQEDDIEEVEYITVPKAVTGSGEE